MAITGNGYLRAQSRTQRAYGVAARRAFARRGSVPGAIHRAVGTPARSLEAVGLLGEVPAGEATLAFRGAVERRHETAVQRTYRALLRFPGIVPADQRVEIDVVTFGAGLGALALRSTEPLGRRVSPARYEAAAGAALEAVERMVSRQEATGAARQAVVLAETGARLASAPGEERRERAA